MKGRKSPLPAIILLIIALVALIYSEYTKTTSYFVYSGGAASAGLGIGHAIAIICLLGAAVCFFRMK